MDVSDWLMPLGIFGPGSFDERGLLGLAFHPNYAINGLIYTYTSEPVSVPPDFATTLPPGIDADHQSVVTEWRVTDHTEASGYVDMTSVITSGRRVLLRIDEPQFNHNGGSVVFDPDGLLYIAVGDGGGADDRDGQPFIGGPMVGHSLNGNGQDTSNPLGAILRIDPQGDNSTNGQYGIPPDNPFVSDPSLGLGEIYAYGLRNPFRISFDTKDEDLYAGDVGQNDIEEINIIEKGGNYGWNRKEGNFFFNPNGIYSGFVHNDDPGDLINLIDPVLQYDHDEGISVTGGFVYRGQLFKQLKGKYVFGDWSNSFSIPSGRLFYQHQSSIHEFNLSDRPILGLFLHGFGQDHDGEIRTDLI
jgi:glucose/arabinose dehydrogenase